MSGTSAEKIHCRALTLQHHGLENRHQIVAVALRVADDGEYGRITICTLQARDTNETLSLLLAQRAIMP